MSDAGRRDADRAGADRAATHGSIGSYLAGQRRLRGISIDELCERTKIPRRNLERLEAGAFDDHRDGFARGFVRTVAQALGLDADEAVMRLMHEPDGDEELGRGISLPVLLLRFAAGAALVGTALAIWSLAVIVFGGEEPPAAEPALRVRQDAVRRLAEGIATSPARTASEAATPEMTPAPEDAPPTHEPRPDLPPADPAP